MIEQQSIDNLPCLCNGEEVHDESGHSHRDAIDRRHQNYKEADQYSTVIFRSGLTNEEYSKHFGYHLRWFTVGIKGTKGVDGKGESNDRHCAWTVIEMFKSYIISLFNFRLQTSVHTKSCTSYQFSPSFIYNHFELCALLIAFLIPH